MKTAFLDSESLRAWAKVDPFRNILFLVLDLLTAGGILTAAVVFFESRGEWGLHWIWNVPVGMGTIILVGSVQHRIALMGHEASHRLLHPNRKWNDLLAEVACFSPLFALFSQYRARHLSHHLYTNDPKRDSNLSGNRAEKLYARFPMERGAFVYQYYLKFFWPPAVIGVFFDLLRVTTIDAGFSPIPWRRAGQPDGQSGRPSGGRPLFRNATIHGVLFFVVLIFLLDSARRVGLGFLMGAAPAALATGVIAWALMPASWFYDPAAGASAAGAPAAGASGGNLAYSPKMSGLIRLIFYTFLFVSINVGEILTGIWIGGYVAILWFVPLVYVFPYLMLLREIFQHANADEGEITNSRVIHVDPFTRWALFGYGNDVHIVHHIYPNIPHYRLTAVHREMCQQSENYRDTVEEAFGVLGPGREGHSAVEALALSKREGETTETVRDANTE